jgi:hypothetical protein
MRTTVLEVPALLSTPAKSIHKIPTDTVTGVKRKKSVCILWVLYSQQFFGRLIEGHLVRIVKGPGT